MSLTNRRTTKYVRDVKDVLSEYGHATNSDISATLKAKYPSLSATTIHRVTQRLYEDGAIGRAPKTLNGSVRYDAISVPHDHFICSLCGHIKDIDLPNTCRTLIRCSLDDCGVSGPLTVSGICRKCHDSWKENV